MTQNASTSDLPSGWEWRSGERGSSYYTRWFGTEYRMGGPLAGKDGLGGYDGEVYWDEGGEHHVAIYPILSIREDGDPRVSEYPVKSRSFESEDEALEAVPELITELLEEGR